MFSAARSTGSIPTMSTPLVEQREQQLEAWKRFLRAHAALTRQLSADLVAEHGLTINDYEVLLHLSRRVVYAKLTDAGLDKLREASRTHLAGVDELFVQRYSEQERATLAELLGRLPAAGADTDCTEED